MDSVLPGAAATTLPYLTGPINGTEAQWRIGEFGFCKLLQALPVAVYTTDAAGRITFYNEAAAELWGCRPELGKSEICGSWRLRWPDGRPMRHDECPMAIALKEQRPVFGEAVAERPDGVRIPFLAYPKPLFDEAGRLAGAVNTLVDITERKKAENAAQRLAAIVESSDDAIVSKDLNGIVMTWNPGAERLFGYTAEEAIGQPILMLVIPPDRQSEEATILERIRRGERIDHYETIRRRKDGSLVDISLTVSPLRNADGTIIGASKIARDISERRQAQEQQCLLFREMNHRIRNLFTLAGTIVSLSTRFATTPEELADAVNARLVALGRAHDLTMADIAGGAKNFDKATTLPDLAHTILAPYRTDGSLTIDGPDVPVSGKPAMSIALLLHELATNAAKYGALTSELGRVELSWRVSEDELALTWRERGGPPVTGRPETEGFGSVLARRTATGQLKGKIVHDWNEEGLTVNLSTPVGRLVE
jgi:PAS domain S-box-containing protein